MVTCVRSWTARGWACLVMATLWGSPAFGMSADESESPAHGARSSAAQFPSHSFRVAPRWPSGPQVAVHAGLLQPILFDGFNAAVDLRWGPLVVTYSHGAELDYSATPSLGLTRAEAEAGMSLRSPWTTGGGVGVTVIDEVYAMVDLKVHRYTATLGDQSVRYVTSSLGGEIGWRFFAWQGLFVQPMLRYWPNVYSSLPGNQARLGSLRHQAKDLGLFANVSLGWALDL